MDKSKVEEFARLIGGAKEAARAVAPAGWRWRLSSSHGHAVLAVKEAPVDLPKALGRAILTTLGQGRTPAGDPAAEAGLIAAEAAMKPLLDAGFRASMRLGGPTAPFRTAPAPKTGAAAPAAFLRDPPGDPSLITGLARPVALPVDCPDSKRALADWLAEAGWLITVGNSSRMPLARKRDGQQIVAVARQAGRAGWWIHAERAAPMDLGWQPGEDGGLSLVDGRPRGYALPKDCPLHWRIWVDVLATRGWGVVVGNRVGIGASFKWRLHEVELIARRQASPSWTIHAARRIPAIDPDGS
jgi:hypothetical protein